MHDQTHVGAWRFCPHCARALTEGDYVPITFEFEDMVCTGCSRPWIACPCEPVIALSEGVDIVH
jgi:hypothetical protein